MKYEETIILEKIEASKRKLLELLSQKERIGQLNAWLKTELTYTSNGLEGSTLTRQETILAIEEQLTSGSKPIKHYWEAINHAKAFSWIYEQIRAGICINEAFILEIHKKILDGIDSLNAGFYRSVRVRILGSRTILPNPLKIPDLMKEFCDWLVKTKQSPIEKALEAHYRLVTIHPFIDGNGRTARLLMNAILMQAQYAPMIIRRLDRKRYLSSIEKRQVDGQGDYYRRFMLQALNRSLKMVIAQLDEPQSHSASKGLTISKFAQKVNLPVSTVRYWVKIGKLKPAAYSDSGYMFFSPDQTIE